MRAQTFGKRGFLGKRVKEEEEEVAEERAGSAVTEGSGTAVLTELASNGRCSGCNVGAVSAVLTSSNDAKQQPDHSDAANLKQAEEKKNQTTADKDQRSFSSSFQWRHIVGNGGSTAVLQCSALLCRGLNIKRKRGKKKQTHRRPERRGNQISSAAVSSR